MLLACTASMSDPDQMSLKLQLIPIALVAMVLSVVGVCGYYGWSSYRRSDLKARSRAAALGRRWTELESLAEQWSAWEPRNGEAWMLRANGASGQEDWQSAAKHLSSIPDGDPRIIPAMIELSKLSFTQLNDPLQGVAACERILRNDPAADGARQQLIWFYAMTLQREQLLNHIRTAIELGSEPRESYVYYFLVDTFRSAEAVKLNQKWLESAPQAEVFQVARIMHMSDRESGLSDSPDAATAVETPGALKGQSKLELVAELLKRYPHNVELLAYKAEDCLKAGDVECASTLLSQAPVGARQDSRFWRIRGWLHELDDKLELAADDYHQALKLHPVDWNTMNRLVIVERRRQNISEVERLNKLVEKAQSLRQFLQKLPAVEVVPPPALLELSKLARDCNDRLIEPGLVRRLASAGMR